MERGRREEWKEGGREEGRREEWRQGGTEDGRREGGRREEEGLTCLNVKLNYLI